MIDIEYFLSKLSEQKESYKNMLLLSSRQKELVSSDDYDSLYQLSEEKKKIMDHIEKVEVVVGPIKSDWSVLKQQLAIKDVSRVETIVDEAIDILKQIISIEEDCRKIMDEKRKRTYGSISGISTLRKFDSYKSKDAQGGIIDTGS